MLKSEIWKAEMGKAGIKRPVFAILLLAAGLVRSLAQEATGVVALPAQVSTNNITVPSDKNLLPARPPVLSAARVISA